MSQYYKEAERLVWKWAQLPDQDGCSVWKDSQRKEYFEWQDVKSKVEDIVAAFVSIKITIEPLLNEEARRLEWAREIVLVALANSGWYEVADRQDWRERIANLVAPDIAAALARGD